MNLCNVECIYRKNTQDEIPLFIRGPRFPEMAHPWRPTHSIKATSCKSEVRSRFAHDSLILMLVGLSRFISTVTAGNLLPDESITPFQPEMESELQAMEDKLREGLSPPLLVGIPGISGSTGTMSQHHRGKHRPRPLTLGSTHMTFAPTATTLKTKGINRHAQNQGLHLQLGFWTLSTPPAKAG